MKKISVKFYKYIFLIFLNFALYQSMTSQGCSDYVEIKVVSLSVTYGICSTSYADVSVNGTAYPGGSVVGQTVYQSATMASNNTVSLYIGWSYSGYCYGTNFNVGSAGSRDVTIDDHPPYYEWYNGGSLYLSGSNTSITLGIQYRRRPPNISSSIVNPILNNENDTVTLNASTYPWSCNWEYSFNGNSTVLSTSNPFNDVLDNMNILDKTQVIYRVWGAYGSRRSCSPTYSTPIWIYPPRPTIDPEDARGYAPSCYGGGDGSILIGRIDGAIGNGVDKYKLAIARGTCPNKENGNIGDFDPNAILIFKENEQISYLTETTHYPIVIDSTWFYRNHDTPDHPAQNPLTSGSYCVLLENVYVDGQSAFMNGYTFTNVLIPGKVKLSAAAPDTRLDCNGDTDGSVKLTVSGGNPPFSAYLKTANDSLIEYVKTLTSVTINSAEHTFNGLSADSYYIRLIDKNNCNVFVDNIDQGSDSIKNIQVTQPPVLNLTFLSMDSILCKGDLKGEIGFLATGGTPNQPPSEPGIPYYTYNVYKNGTPFIKEAVLNSGDYFYLDNLQSATYTFQLNDTKSCIAEYTNPFDLGNSISISEPDQKLSIIDTILSNPNGNGYEIDCFGNSTGSVELIPSGGYGPYYYSLGNRDMFNPLQSPAFGNLAAVEYTFYITDRSYNIPDKQHCIDSVTILLEQPSELIIDHITLNDYNGFNIACEGESDTIFISASGGVLNYQYKTESGIFKPDSFLIADQFTSRITVKDSNECTTSLDTTLRMPASRPSIATVDVSNLSENYGYALACYGDSDAQITVRPLSGSGTVVTGQYYRFSVDSIGIFEPFQYDSTYSNLKAGNYHLKIMDANNCESNELIWPVTQPAPLSFTTTKSIHGPFNIKCAGDSNGSINISGNGGISTQDYNYYINGDTYDNPMITGLAAGTYSVYIKDINGCISPSRNEILVEPNPVDFTFQPSNYFGGHPIRCDNLTDSLKISPSGGWGSSYTDGYYNVRLNNLTIKPVNPGNTFIYYPISAELPYRIYVTDKLNCKDSSEILSFTQPDPMTNVPYTAYPTLCSYSSDGRLDVGWTGGSGIYDFFLKKASLYTDTLFNITTSTLATFEGLSKGTYRVVAEDQNHCIDSTVNFQISGPNELTYNTKSIDQPDCFGDTLGSFTISAQDGTPSALGYDFYVLTSYGDSVYIPAVNPAIFTDIGLGTHTYFIKDNHDCLSYPDVFTITQPNELNIAFSTQNVSGFGGDDGSATANVTGGTATYSYKWRDANELVIGYDQNITGMPAGDYSVEVWDANKCPYHNLNIGLKQYVTINEPNSALELFIEQVHHVSSPGGNDGSVTLSSSGGWGQHTYKMDNGVYTAAPLFEELSEGLHTFCVTDGNSVDCIDTLIVAAETLQIASIDIQQVSCNGLADASASISISGGTPPYLYSLNHINYSSNNTFTNLSAGNYSVFVKDLYGIEAQQSFTVTEPVPLTASITDVVNTSCGNTDGALTVSVNGGTTPYTYNWFLNGEPIGQYNAQAENLQAGLYTVEVMDNNGCTQSTQGSVNTSDGPVINGIETADASCFNTSDGSASIMGITANGSYTILWSTGQIDVTAITGLSAGNYSVTVDEGGCIAIAQFNITAPSNLNFNFQTTAPSCHDGCNGTIHALPSGGTAPYTYQWQNINGNPVTSFVAGLCPDTYILNVSDVNNCLYVGTALLENPAPLIIFDDEGTTLCQGQSITLDAGNPGSSYQWSSDNGFTADTRMVTVNEEGLYQVNVITPYGCTGSDQFTLTFGNRFLEANFLMQSEAEVGDTVVLVEISWEAPDSVAWDIPSALWLLDMNEQNLQLVPTRNGVFTVGLTAFLGMCADYIEKQITVSGMNNKNFGMPEYSDEERTVFKSVNLFPNPNNGMFTLNLELIRESDVTVEVYDLMGRQQQGYQIGKGQKNYSFDFNIQHINKGVYFVFIKTDKGTTALKFFKK